MYRRIHLRNGKNPATGLSRYAYACPHSKLQRSSRGCAKPYQLAKGLKLTMEVSDFIVAPPASLSRHNKSYTSLSPFLSEISNSGRPVTVLLRIFIIISLGRPLTVRLWTFITRRYVCCWIHLEFDDNPSHGVGKLTLVRIMHRKGVQGARQSNDSLSGLEGYLIMI